jgi:hypothetical protein
MEKLEIPLLPKESLWGKGDTNQKSHAFEKIMDFKLIPRGLCPEVVYLQKKANNGLHQT